MADYRVTHKMRIGDNIKLSCNKVKFCNIVDVNIGARDLANGFFIDKDGRFDFFGKYFVPSSQILGIEILED